VRRASSARPDTVRRISVTLPPASPGHPGLLPPLGQGWSLEPGLDDHRSTPNTPITIIGIDAVDTTGSSRVYVRESGLSRNASGGVSANSLGSCSVSTSGSGAS